MAYRGFLLIVLTAAFAAISTHASAAPLKSELEGLLKEHPQIKAGEKTVDSAKSEIDKARANFYPQVSVRGDTGPEYIDSPERRAEANGKAWSRRRTVGTLTVTQNLFDGFATLSATDTAKLAKRVSEVDLDNTRQNVLFEGITAYIDVLRARRLVELALANEDTIRTQLKLEDERVQRGSGITVDVLQAKSRLQIAKERRVNFQGRLIDATTRYTQVFEHSPDVDTMVQPKPPEDALPGDLQTAVEIATNENPVVVNSLVNVDIAMEKRRAARSGYFPSFDVVGRADYEKDRNAILGTRRDYSILLQAQWDLFSGFSTSADVARAASDYGVSQEKHTYVVNKVVEQAKLAWQAMETQTDRVELLQNAVNIASEVFASRRRLREAGKETVINVLDAQTEINNAEIDLTSARFDRELAIYQLLLAMGRLNPATLGLIQTAAQ